MSPGGNLSVLFAVSFLSSLLSVLDYLFLVFDCTYHFSDIPFAFLGTSRIEWLDMSERCEAFREKSKLGSTPFSSFVFFTHFFFCRKTWRVVFQYLRQTMKDELWKMLSLAHHRPTVSISKSYEVFVPGVFNKCYQ